MDILSNAAIEGGRGRQAPRLLTVDAARGAAVIAMATYHTAWDLSELRLIATAVTAEPAWSWFARATASSFLLLAGLGLVLAHRAGIRWGAFGRRVAVLAAASLILTIATLVVFPDSYIFFGVLHHIAVASLLALPFLRGPASAAIVAAALVWAAPLLLTEPIFNEPVLAFLGLGTRIPDTNDWVPIFPWFGFVLAGVALGKVAAPRLEPRESRGPRVARVLAWLGRHSLLIYLLHQPLIFGALSGIVAITGPNPVAEAAAFGRACEPIFTRSGQEPATARAACACTGQALGRESLVGPVLGNRLSPDQTRRVGEVARRCLEEALPSRPE